MTLAPLPTQDVPAIYLDPIFHAQTNVAQNMASLWAYPMIIRSIPPTQRWCLSCSSIFPPANPAYFLIYTIGICSQLANLVTTGSKCIKKKPPYTSPTMIPTSIAAETPPKGYIILSLTPNLNPLPTGQVPSPMRKIVFTPWTPNSTLSNTCTFQLLAPSSAYRQKRSKQDNLLTGPDLHLN